MTALTYHKPLTARMKSEKSVLLPVVQFGGQFTRRSPKMCLNEGKRGSAHSQNGSGLETALLQVCFAAPLDVFVPVLHPTGALCPETLPVNIH